MTDFPSRVDLSWLKGGPWGTKSPSTVKKKSPSPRATLNMDSIFQSVDSIYKGIKSKEERKTAIKAAQEERLHIGTQRMTRSTSKRMGATPAPVQTLDESLSAIRKERTARKKQVKVAADELADLLSSSSMFNKKKPRTASPMQHGGRKKMVDCKNQKRKKTNVSILGHKKSSTVSQRQHKN